MDDSRDSTKTSMVSKGDFVVPSLGVSPAWTNPLAKPSENRTAGACVEH